MTAHTCWTMLATLTLLFGSSISAAGADVKKTDGSVTNVTLYRGQALVTRAIEVAGDKGSLEIVVGNLPEQVVPGSMFAEGGDRIEVRAVQFRSRAVGEEPREEVRKLDTAIEDVTDQIGLNEKTLELLTKRTQYLDKLEGFVAPTATAELSKGVLNAESLEKITKFSFDQRTEIATDQVRLAKQGRDLQKQLTLLQRQRSELTGGASRTVREAVLFIQKNADDKETVRLNYLVSNCGWSPTYTMRAGEDRKEVQVEYNALIHQLSGEDWGDVSLTLSTASPALSASGPGLAPLRVSLSGADNQQKQVGNAQELLSQVRSIQKRQQMAIRDNINTDNFSDLTRSSWTLNDIAGEFQRMELISDKSLIRTLQRKPEENGEGPSISYRLAGTVSLPSRSDQQMVRIMQTSFKSRFYHVATPVLTTYVYREAELTNDSQQDLLMGPINVYLDSRFVGRVEIPTVARGQSFVVGFGADPQLRVRRELAEKKDGVQGGNRELQFSYRLVVENYKGEATPIRVLDRLPSADRVAEVRVTLGEMSDKLSDDKLYMRRERPMGILRWDIDAPAGATGENSRLIEYAFSVEYDRNFTITSPVSKEQLQEEFERLQRGRQRL